MRFPPSFVRPVCRSPFEHVHRIRTCMWHGKTGATGGCGEVRDPSLSRCSAYRRCAYGRPTMTRALKGPGAVPHVCSRELVLSQGPPCRVLCSRRTIEATRFSVGTIACMNAWASSSFVPKYEMTLLLTSEPRHSPTPDGACAPMCSSSESAFLFVFQQAH